MDENKGSIFKKHNNFSRFSMNVESNQQLEEFLNLFEKDYASISLYLLFASFFKANERKLISLSELSQKLGMGKSKLKNCLSKLESLDLIKINSKVGTGVEIVLYRTNLVPDRSNLVPDRTNDTVLVPDRSNLVPDRTNEGLSCTQIELNNQNLESNIASYNSRVSKTFVLHEVERLDLTGTPRTSMFIPIPNTYSSPKDKDLNKDLTKTKTKSRNPAKKKIRVEPPEEVKELAKIWFDWSCSQTPSTKFNLQKFEDAIWAMTKKTQRDLEDIKRLFAFIKSDQKEKGFCYARNFISPTKWNKVWSNDLTALDNAFNSMGKAQQEGYWKWAHVPQDKLTDEQIADLF